MLVISRQRDESLIIGRGTDAAEVVVVDIRGDKVRLGVTVRPEIPVDRLEVRERKEEGNSEKPFHPTHSRAIVLE